MYVEYVLAPPGIAVGVVLHGPKNPVLLSGHGIGRNLTQKLHLVSLDIDSFDESIHIRRIPGTIDIDSDTAPVGCVFVKINGMPHLPQLVMEDLFLVPPDLKASNRV